MIQMRLSTKRRTGMTVRTGVLLLCLIIVLVPFYIIVINSFKPYAEIAKNIFAWPGENFTLVNYENAWRHLNFANSLKNTAVITILSNFGGVVF